MRPCYCPLLLIVLGYWSREEDPFNKLLAASETCELSTLEKLRESRRCATEVRCLGKGHEMNPGDNSLGLLLNNSMRNLRRRMMEDYRARKRDVYIVFIDLEKSYKVLREGL